MELNKSNIKKILSIILISLTFFWGINHISVIMNFFGTVIPIFSPIIMGLCFAFVINVLLRPVEKVWDKLFTKCNNKITKKLKRPLCMLISILLIVGAVFILLFMLIPEIRNTFVAIAELFPQYLEKVEDTWDDVSVLLKQYSIVLPDVELDLTEIANKLSAFVSKIGVSFIGKTVDFTGSIFSVIFNLVLAFTFSIYILSQKESLGKSMQKTLRAVLSPKAVERVEKIVFLCNRSFTNFITGQLTEAVIIGLLCFVGMSIFRIPYAPVVSVLVGCTALIPVFGAFIGTAIGAFLILMVNPIKAVWFVVFIIVLQQLEGNLIYPRIVGKSVGLPGIWVLSAVTIGSGLFGVVGMLISVPVFSVLYTLVNEAIDYRLKVRGIVMEPEEEETEQVKKPEKKSEKQELDGTKGKFVAEPKKKN